MKTKPTRFSFCQNAENDYYSVHADNCGHLTRRGPWGCRPSVRYEGAESVQEAIDKGLSDEEVALGYGIQDVKVQSCCGLTAKEMRALVDPRDVRKCSGCGKTWNQAPGCSHDDGCRGTS